MPVIPQNDKDCNNIRGTGTAELEALNVAQHTAQIVRFGLFRMETSQLGLNPEPGRVKSSVLTPTRRSERLSTRQLNSALTLGEELRSQRYILPFQVDVSVWQLMGVRAEGFAPAVTLPLLLTMVKPESLHPDGILTRQTMGPSLFLVRITIMRLHKKVTVFWPRGVI